MPEWKQRINEIHLLPEQIEELIKCYKDPIYFIENYVWIEVKETATIVPFRLYPYQKKILQWMIDGRNGLVLKSRRVGASTVVAAYLAWLINFRRGVNALLISINEEKAKKLLAKVKFNLFNIKKHDSDDYHLATSCSWMLNPVVVNNLQFVGIGWYDDDGNLTSTSEVASLTTTKESGRGDSATFVFADELAFLPDQDETMASARLTATRGGNWIAVSTPNGVGNHFHSLCMRAERGENKTFDFLKVHWTEAEITDDMVETATEGLSDSLRLQEMELEFLSTGDPVFNHMHLSACYRPPDEFPEVKAEIEKYKNLVKISKGDYVYFNGVDTAIGKLTKKDSKRDYHCFTALTKSGIQAFTYHTKTELLTEWAGSIENLPGGDYFREGTVSRLHREYPGIVQVEINGPGQMVYNNHKLPEDGHSNIIPKNTTVKSKSQLIQQLIIAVESHAIVITDRFTYQCMTVFQRGSVPGQFGAPPGDYYDDPVMALALAYDALLANGAMEFPWGEDVTNLKRKELTDEENLDVELTRSGYGPSLIKQARVTDRLSDFYDGDELAVIDPLSDLDISRLKSPEFMNG